MPEKLGLEVHLELSFDKAVEQVVSALRAEGFGVLTRIDVQATFKEKLGEDFRPYVILGACNPPLAYRSLLAEASVGLMLPCNVTVEALPKGGALVRIANPELMMQASTLKEDRTLGEVASQARTKLERVAAALR